MFSRVYICLISVSSNEPFICGIVLELFRTRLARDIITNQKDFFFFLFLIIL